MKGEVLAFIFKNDPAIKKWYRGQHMARDTKLSRIRSFPTLIILNTDKEKGPGEHWCLIVIFSPNDAEFFDSFGKSPKNYGFSKELLRHVRTIKYNEFPIQSPLNGTCGHHCIFWIYHRARGISSSKIMKIFDTDNKSRNDSLVYNFVKSKFGPQFARISA